MRGEGEGEGEGKTFRPREKDMGRVTTTSFARTEQIYARESTLLLNESLKSPPDSLIPKRVEDQPTA